MPFRAADVCTTVYDCLLSATVAGVVRPGLTRVYSEGDAEWRRFIDLLTEQANAMVPGAPPPPQDVTMADDRLASNGCGQRCLDGEHCHDPEHSSSTESCDRTHCDNGDCEVPDGYHSSNNCDHEGCIFRDDHDCESECESAHCSECDGDCGEDHGGEVKNCDHPKRCPNCQIIIHKMD